MLQTNDTRAILVLQIVIALYLKLHLKLQQTLFCPPEMLRKSPRQSREILLELHDTAWNFKRSHFPIATIANCTRCAPSTKMAALKTREIDCQCSRCSLSVDLEPPTVKEYIFFFLRLNLGCVNLIKLI